MWVRLMAKAHSRPITKLVNGLYRSGYIEFLSKTGMTPFRGTFITQSNVREETFRENK